VWPGTHNGHFAFEHVDELWHLIEAPFAQKAPYAGNPFVVARGLHIIAFVISLHGAKLMAYEYLAIDAGPLLIEKDALPVED